MKPITVILPGGGTWSMSADEGRTLAQQILRACDAVAPETIDPTPMPAPALGMRVWYSRPLTRGGEHQLLHRNVEHICHGLTWLDLIGEDRVADITLVVDFRTGEVLWRRE